MNSESTAFAIKVITQTQTILSLNAHVSRISDFELASINKQQILFSASEDGWLKAWRIDEF
jgi:hypothetical protein